MLVLPSKFANTLQTSIITHQLMIILFRYIPSEHSSYYDTSGNYYNLMTDSKHHVEEPRVIERALEELVEEEAVRENDPCREKKCTSNEHCCEGTVCVDTSNGGETDILGRPRKEFAKNIIQLALASKFAR